MRRIVAIRDATNTQNVKRREDKNRTISRSVELDGVGAASQHSILKDEQFGLLTRIATESGSLCVRRKRLQHFGDWKRRSA
jgi:hypothetical protein